MRKILKKMRDEKGSITSVVLVTVLFFIIILSTALMISGTQRKSQLDSEITLKQVYQNQVDDAKKISIKLAGVTAPIPDGYYYVGGTDDSGVVISDSKEDRYRYKGEGDVGKDLEGNQWVWVPVENPSSLYTTVTDGIALKGTKGVKTTKYTNSEIISGKTRGLPGEERSYREPDMSSYGENADRAKTAGFSSLANMAETMVSDYEEMIASLEKYKGFYIGRYELTADGEKTGATQTNTNWYILYKNCTTLAKEGSNVKTRMIWGLQWDATCNWLDSYGFSITNSSTWGNYSGVRRNTGFSESWMANNIYDFSGNCSEWTQEASLHRVIRGGNYGNSYYNGPASYRIGSGTNYAGSYNGTRPILYLIP